MSEPNLLPLDVHCKLCKKPFVAWNDADCPKEWVDKFLHMLCCDKCYDEYLDAVRREDEARARFASERLGKKVRKNAEEEKGARVQVDPPARTSQHWYMRD